MHTALPPETTRPPWHKRIVLALVPTIIFAVCALFIANVFIERKALERQEKQFNTQQQVQTHVARLGLDGVLSGIDKNARILSRHGIPALSSKLSSQTVFKQLLESILAEDKILLHLSYFTVPSAAAVSTSQPTAAGDAAITFGEATTRRYWEAVQNAQTLPFVPPPLLSHDFQMLTLLYPASQTPDARGVLTVVVDLAALAKRFIEPLHIGARGAGYLLDDDGNIIYDHEKQIIGRNIFDGIHNSFTELERVDKLLVTKDSGMDEYSFTSARGSAVTRKLVAWNSFAIGDRRLVVVAATPEAEIANTLTDLHDQQALAWTTLFLLLLASGALFLYQTKAYNESASRKRLLDIIENLPDATFVVDKKKRIIAWNKAIEEMTGFTKKEMLSCQPRQYSIPFYGEQRDVLIDYLDPSLGTPHGYENFEREGDVLRCEVFVPRLNDGKGAYLWMTASPLPSVDGSPAGAIQSLRDITKRKEYQQRIAENEERYALALAGANDGIWDWDVESNTVYFSPRWKEIIGYRSDEISNDVREWTSRIHPDDKTLVLAANNSVIYGSRDHFEVEYRILHKDGHYRWTLGRGAGLRDADGTIRRVAGAHTDITERKHTENVNSALFKISSAISTTRDIDDLFAAIHATLKEYIGARNLIIALIDEEADKLRFHYLRDEVETRLDAIDDISTTKPRGLNMTVLREGRPVLLDKQQQLAVGVIGTPSEIWLGAPLKVDGKTIGVISTQDYSDPHKFTKLDVEFMVSVSEQVAMAIGRKMDEEELSRLALHDPLTGLPNRNLFNERLERALRRSQRQDSRQFAVLLFDLDGFKKVNDTYGHKTGDLLLTTIADRLQPALRTTDTMARLGGDEFAILLEDFATPREVIRIVKRVQREVQRPLKSGSTLLTVSASIGIVLRAGRYSSPEDIVHDADTAMYEAKREGKGTFMFFNHEMHEQTVRMLEMENDLRSAVKHNEFTLQYQPLYEAKSGKLSGLEALVRWQHPTRGVIMPNSFLTAAEDCNLMAAIDRIVIEQACLDMKQLTVLGLVGQSTSIHINISGAQLRRADLPGLISDALTKAGLPGHRLNIEFSEKSAMANPSFTLDMFRRLKALDVGLILDDFGTASSSLFYLHRFPIDAVKIDCSFTSNICSDSENRRIVKSMTALAASMNVQVVAEGVETEPQLDILTDLHCQAVQGYLLGKPADFDHIATFGTKMPPHSATRN